MDNWSSPEREIIGAEVDTFTVSLYLFLFRTMAGKLIMFIKSVLASVLELHAAHS